MISTKSDGEGTYIIAGIHRHSYMVLDLILSLWQQGLWICAEVGALG